MTCTFEETLIEYHNDFPYNNEVSNIEFGASINYFGKKFFNKCFLTDIEDKGLPHFTKIDNISYGNCHFLDSICDFNSFNPSNKKFDNIIFCNPYGVGFRGRENSRIFLNNAGKLLKENGKIHLITNHTNSWGKFQNAKNYLDKLKEDNLLNYNLVIENMITLDENHEFVTNQKYTFTDINQPTTPTQYFIIKKISNV